MKELITCTPKSLPAEQWIDAAREAVRINPANHLPAENLARALGDSPPAASKIALLINRRWPSSGVRLTVGFMDNPLPDLRARILLHMNVWGQRANVQFVETQTDPQVRIARGPTGYWSYLGTDILRIPANQPTMNLQEFSMGTLESEFHRVVRHETGHTLGFPHEHMRHELVNRIDPEKAIAYFGQTQGWTPDEVRRQVLTPIEESSILGTTHADAKSIMCYQIPGIITRDGKPIEGGLDIDESDYQFAQSVYPKVVHPNG